MNITVFFRLGHTKFTVLTGSRHLSLVLLPPSWENGDITVVCVGIRVLSPEVGIYSSRRQVCEAVGVRMHTGVNGVMHAVLSPVRREGTTISSSTATRNSNNVSSSSLFLPEQNAPHIFSRVKRHPPPSIQGITIRICRL